MGVLARVGLGSLGLLAVVACKSVEQKAAEAVAEGNAALQQGKLLEAGQAFERAQGLKPYLPEVALGKAEIAVRQQEGERALQLLDTCSGLPACQARSQQIVEAWLEAGKRSPLTTQAAKQLVLALRHQEGPRCGLFAALAYAAQLKAEQAADRALLREMVRAELGAPVEVSDADPSAPLLRAAAAAGKLAGSEEGCDAARQGETALLGRMTTLAQLQGEAPGSLGLSELGARLSSVYWSNALHERFRGSESAPAEAAAAAPSAGSAPGSPSQGPGCEAFQKCCEAIGATMPTGSICPLSLAKFGSCDEARRQVGLLFAASGGELPASCK